MLTLPRGSLGGPFSSSLPDPVGVREWNERSMKGAARKGRSMWEA